MLWPVFAVLKAMVRISASPSPPTTSTVIQAATAGFLAGSAPAVASSSFAASIAWATNPHSTGAPAATPHGSLVLSLPERWPDGRRTGWRPSLSPPVRTVRRRAAADEVPGVRGAGDRPVPDVRR